MKIDYTVFDKLLCPKCDSPVFESSTDTIGCTKCSSSFDYKFGVVDLLIGKSKKTKLEDLDYDAKAGLDSNMIDKIGQSWAAVFDNAAVDLDGKAFWKSGPAQAR